MVATFSAISSTVHMEQFVEYFFYLKLGCFSSSLSLYLNTSGHEELSDVSTSKHTVVLAEFFYYTLQGALGLSATFAKYFHAILTD